MGPALAAVKGMRLLDLTDQRLAKFFATLGPAVQQAGEDSPDTCARAACDCAVDAWVTPWGKALKDL